MSKEALFENQFLKKLSLEFRDQSGEKPFHQSSTPLID